jgi:chemotaxis protein MotB
LITLAEELGKLPNKIYIEGHTDSKAYAENSNYTNWELSVERANAARRIMQQHGLRADQVTQVRGYADQSLRDQGDPLDPANRRISLIVQYRIKASDAKSEDPAAAEGKSGEEKKPAAEGAAKK